MNVKSMLTRDNRQVVTQQTHQ